jgi:hypothetical protein
MDSTDVGNYHFSIQLFFGRDGRLTGFSCRRGVPFYDHHMAHQYYPPLIVA